MFGLRQKLFLGLGGLLAIIGILGGLSIARLTELGRSIDVIMRENYRSVVACQTMKDSLERMDSAALFVLVGEKEQGWRQIEANRERFLGALGVEMHNITLPGEKQRADTLQSLFSGYIGGLQKLKAVAGNPTEEQSLYFSTLLPAFQAIKSNADDILTMNQNNMRLADSAARRQAGRARRQMYALLFSAVLLTSVFLVLTGRWILTPIKQLTEYAEDIGRGNLELVAPPSSRDEIGRLTASFNDMAASLRELRRSDRAKLARVERATKQAFHNLPEIVVVLSPEGEVEVSTREATSVFGLRQGIRIEDIPHAWIRDLVSSVLSTGDEAVRDGLVQQFAGTKERFFRPKAFPMLSPGEGMTGVILFIEDVTTAQEQEELKRGVISTVAHQLKTPLTSLRMAVHLLLEEKADPLTEKQTELLAAARDESERLSTILEDLLDISRIQSGKSLLGCLSLQPGSLTRQAIEQFAAEARDRGVALTADVGTGLPNVWADPSRVVHVFANLLSNALRYTRAGGSVTVSAVAEERDVRFAVTDTGAGIKEEHLGHVFEPFYRVSVQGEPEGAGLGLSIAKEIVDAHGGALSVESREGVGSTFSFTLPHAERMKT